MLNDSKTPRSSRRNQRNARERMGNDPGELSYPALLMLAYVVFYSIISGIYVGADIQASSGITILNFVVLLYVLGYWLQSDARKHGIRWPLDIGFFMIFAWPFIVTYHLYKTRGGRGLLIVVGWLALAVVGALTGLFLYIGFSSETLLSFVSRHH